MLNLILALLSAALLIVAFPRFEIAWLAPVALTPLLIAVARETRHWRRFAIGWAAGVLYWFGVCYWIQAVLSIHGGMGEVAGWAAFTLFAVTKALHMGVFALLAGPLMRRWWAVPGVAALWVAVEVTHGSLGFAWLALGNAGINMAMPVRVAPYAGVYGLSFMFMVSAATLALAIMRRRRREMAWIFMLLLLPLFPRMPDASAPRESALLAQPNISPTEEWTKESLAKSIQRQLELSIGGVARAGGNPPSIIAWPEVPQPLYYEEDPEFRAYANSLAKSVNAHLLIGVVAHTRDGAPLNSAALISPSGELVSRYDKVNLVPFGEFVPWPFGFANKISTEVGDFAAGSRVVVSSIGPDRRIGAFICYESVFPNFVRRFADQGAGALFNISNDGWFGKTAARFQHLAIVRMRAAENRRWILRATNDGITTAVDPAGRVRATAPLYAEAALAVRFDYVNEKTLYTRWGDWFPLLCAMLAAFCLVACRVAGPAKPR